MMRFSSTLLLAALIVIFSGTSCHKTEVAPTTKTGRTLVLISDNDPSSDMIVGIEGAVRSQFPSVQVYYYKSKPFDVYEGAYLLYYAMLNYPQGTVFAGIVEPGASSKRIVYQAGDTYILSPDNTLSTRVFNYYQGIICYFVENPEVLGGSKPEDLTTQAFYKQAILSMLSGTLLSKFGPVCPNPQKFQVQEPVISGDTVKGEILFTDNFGNCITNIPQGIVSQFPQGTVLNLRSDTTLLTTTMGVTYSSVPVGSNVCFVNSSFRLELAVNYGNFSAKYHVSAGSKIRLWK